MTYSSEGLRPLMWCSMFLLLSVASWCETATEQEDEPLQVPVQLTEVVGGLAHKLFQRCAQAGTVAW